MEKGKGIMTKSVDGYVKVRFDSFCKKCEIYCIKYNKHFWIGAGSKR